MKILALSSAIVMLAGTAAADEFRPALEAYLEAELRGWINDPVLVAAIKEQNTRTMGFSSADIDQLDREWRDGLASGSSDIVDDVLRNPAADFLRSRVEESEGAITEAFTMDAIGLNVSASSATSDYWQGDEAKFQKTFGLGAGSVHYSEIEFDESSQTYQGQVSVVIVDPSNNEAIGAITIGINAESLL
ncbi:hypothetical protein [Pseudoruegeria sp. HB172150]|uniref:hypothetical protein n=1 Tax=Pseudoruegeria sp. HB172150 TaxID=2721164 RepID=UPI0020A68F45|nr:hypothetical protein [Pseudoruegeria sp. HB172150]